MADLKAVEDPRREDIIDMLQGALEMAQRGEIQDVVLVASIKDQDGPGVYRFASFSDRWRILGALEYAKDSIHNG